MLLTYEMLISALTLNIFTQYHVTRIHKNVFVDLRAFRDFTNVVERSKNKGQLHIEL